jgi:hypothetical protein
MATAYLEEEFTSFLKASSKSDHEGESGVYL